MVVVRVRALLAHSLRSNIKWGKGQLPIVRTLERLAGVDIFEGINTGSFLADISESTALERAETRSSRFPNSAGQAGLVLSRI